MNTKFCVKNFIVRIPSIAADLSLDPFGEAVGEAPVQSTNPPQGRSNFRVMGL